MKRLMESDGTHVDEALRLLMEADAVLRQIDLRTYASDEEIKQNIADVKVEIRGCRKALRHVRGLRWKR